MNKVMRGVFVLFWVGILLLAVSIIGGAASYDLKVEINPEEGTITGVEEVMLAEGASQAIFLLLANFDREENPFLSERAIDETYPHGFEPALTTITRVEAVQSEGTVDLSFRLLSLPPAFQTYSLSDTILVVDLAEGPATLRIHFITNVPYRTTGDQGIDSGVLTWRFGWAPILLPQDEDWHEEDGILKMSSDEPGLDRSIPLVFPTADYRAEITLPSEVKLACGADHVEAIDQLEEGSHSYRLWNDFPSSSVALAAGADYERFALDELAIPIEVFFLPGHEEEARLFATYARDILSDYQERFGPYARTRLTIVENPNKNGLSMAADGIVWLSSLFFTHRDVTLPGILNRYAEFVLAHEIAHQWWGVGTGVDLNAQNWLSEGMAQYLSISYFEGRHGEFGPNTFPIDEKGILENLVGSQFGFLNLREHQIELPYIGEVERGFDEALIKPLDEVAYENATVVRLYDKGYLVARTIAAALGVETFEKGLREAGLQFRHQRIDVEDLRAILEEVSGQSLEELFRVWVYGAGSVDYEIEIVSRVHDESGYQIVVEVRRDGGAVQPVTIEAILESGETVREEWNGVDSPAEITFSTEEKVRRVTIDPDHFTLDRDRLNNNDPVKFVTITEENTFPLDAYIIRPDPLSQGVTLTYLDRLRLSLSNGAASAEIFQGRNHHLFIDASIEEEELAGSIGYSYTSFAPRLIGSPGTFWEATTMITLSGRRIIAQEGPLNYVHLSVTELPSITHSCTSSLSLDLTPDGAGRVSIAAFDEVRLFPRIYLQGMVHVGTSFGELPSALFFNLDELMSFGTIVQAMWVPDTFPGRHKLYGRLAIEIPSPNDELYNLANLMMVDRVRARCFIACGTSWTNFDEFGKTTPNLEAGIEGVFDLSAVGGLLPFEAVVGYATPILGDGLGMFYFGFSL
jgi:hypothetical protein